MAEAKKITSKKAVVKSNVTKDYSLVTIVGTEKSKNLKTDKEYKVSATLADTLVKKGYATLKKK